MAETNVTLSGRGSATLDLSFGETFSAAKWWSIKESLGRLAGGRPNEFPKLLAELFVRVPSAWRDAVARELLYRNNIDACPSAVLRGISESDDMGATRRDVASSELARRVNAASAY